MAVAVLYLFHLDAAGVLGPDEPRYSAIGRAMAASGDWVTPRLWGAPWFEKPPCSTGSLPSARISVCRRTWPDVCQLPC